MFISFIFFIGIIGIIGRRRRKNTLSFCVCICLYRKWSSAKTSRERSAQFNRLMGHYTIHAQLLRIATLLSLLEHILYANIARHLGFLAILDASIFFSVLVSSDLTEDIWILLLRCLNSNHSNLWHKLWP